MTSPQDTAVTRVRRALVTMICSTLFAAAAVGAVTTLGLNPLASTAATTNPITPGNYTGYAFDQCEAPSQDAMTAWRQSSPFRAVGIYISGALRFCQKQTNLTPTWVQTQLAAGWHLLPIHLGAQASCSTKDRYKGDLINPDPTSNYAAARAQGRAEARSATAAALALGIAAQSTLYYDLESFSIKNAACKASALWFLSAWSNQLHTNGFISGVYSSAASGIKALDDARVTRGNMVVLPDQIWIADWNGTADTNSAYIRSDGWPGRRIHQYQGGHNETWGGQTINIDRSYLDLRGNAYTPPPIPTPEGARLIDPKCTTAAINKSNYRYVSKTDRPDLVLPLQCLLKQRGLYTRSITGSWNPKTALGAQAWQKKVKHPVRRAFTRADWVTLLSAGNAGTTLKPGVTGADVIRAQRTLNAATGAALSITGTYGAATQKAASQYQVKNKISPAAGIIAKLTWAAFAKGLW